MAARDSVILTGTPWSHSSSCSAVLRHVALKTKPAGVNRQQSTEHIHGTPLRIASRC